MSEVLDHAPKSWTPSERLVVLAIAEQANDLTRRGYPGIELIAHRAGVDAGTVSRTLNRLAKKGTELRVPMEHGGSRSKVVYAVRGHRTVYEIPRLCPLPTHGTKICIALVDAEEPPEPEERADGGPAIPTQRADGGPVFAEERPDPPPPFGGERADGGPERADGGPPHPLGTLKNPSPQSDGKIANQPHAGRSDWRSLDDDARKAKEEIEKIPEPLRTIVVSLGLTNPDASRAEAMAVHQLIAKQAMEAGNPVKSVKYYTKIADTGGFSMALANVRAQRLVADEKAVADAAAAVKAEILRLRETEPDCGHGTPAGASPHPKTGEPLCPLCRVGVAMPEPETLAELDDTGLITDAYRIAWTEAGHGPIEMTTLRTIGSQAAVSLANGFDRDFLIEVARTAAPKREDLFRTARQLAMEAAQ